MVRKPQYNLRLSDDERRDLLDVAEKHHTSGAKIIKEYIKWLKQGGWPIGYPTFSETKEVRKDG